MQRSLFPNEPRNNGELNQDKNCDNKQQEEKKINKENHLIIPPEQSVQFYDETETIEWDIAKRPNLGVEQTTNKYYHDEEKNSKQEGPVQVLQGSQNDQKEVPRRGQ